MIRCDDDDHEELSRLQDRVDWSVEDLRGLNFALGWGTSGISMLADRLEYLEIAYRREELEIARMQAVINAARAWYYADNSNGPVTDSGVVDIIGDLERAVRALDGGDQ